MMRGRGDRPRHMDICGSGPGVGPTPAVVRTPKFSSVRRKVPVSASAVVANLDHVRWTTSPPRAPR